MVTATATVNSTSLQVGDCVADVSNLSDPRKTVVVPCDTPHEGEVYAIGTDQSNDETTLTTYCTDQYQGYVGIAWANSLLKVTYFHAASGDTTDVQCVVYDPGKMVTVSYKGSQQ